MSNYRLPSPRWFRARSSCRRRFVMLGSTVAVILALTAAFSVPGQHPVRAFPDAQDCPTTDPARNSALITQWYDVVWNQGDLTEIPALLADDVVQHVGNRADTATGGIAKAIAIVREQRFVDFPDLTVSIDDLVSDQDYVVARLTWAGTHSDDLEQYVGFDTSPTFRHVTFGGTSAFRIHCGKIVEEWVSSDLLGLLQQIGAVPLPGDTYGLISVQSAPASASGTCNPGTPASHVAVVNGLYTDVLNPHDLSAVSAFHTADTMFHGSGRTPLIGDLTQASLYAEWFQAHPNLRLTVEKTISQADRVAVIWTAAGTQVGSYTAAGNHPGTGREVTFSGITIYRLTCDRIAETWEHFNNLDLYRQIVDGSAATPPTA